MKNLKNLGLTYRINFYEGLSYNHAQLEVINQYNSTVLTVTFQRNKDETRYYAAKYEAQQYLFLENNSLQDKLTRAIKSHSRKNKIYSTIAAIFPENGKTDCQLTALIECLSYITGYDVPLPITEAMEKSAAYTYATA